jgi:hypothetical protein
MSTSPVVLHAINGLAIFQPSNSATAVVQNQPPSVSPVLHIGQGVETELQKRVKPDLGPDPDLPPLIDVFNPFQPLEPTTPTKAGQANPAQPKTQQPGADQPKADQPKAEPPGDATRTPEPAPPPQDAPLSWLTVPVPAPMAGVSSLGSGAAPAASANDSARVARAPSDAQPAVAALIGVAAAAGSLRLAMAESRRFGMHWLPGRAASSRSARPHIAGGKR